MFFTWKRSKNVFLDYVEILGLGMRIQTLCCSEAV